MNGIATWHVALGVGGLLLLLLVWHVHRSKSAFDFADLLIDPVTNRASLANVTLIFFAALSAWVVVDRELRNLPAVDTILIAVLGIFVAGKAVAAVTNAFKTSDGPTTVRETREITVPAGTDANGTTKP